MTPIAKVKNLGPVTARWLAEIGVHSKEDLLEIGPVEAYRALKAQDHKVSLNALWAMDAGLRGEHWTALTEERKQALHAQLNKYI